ncbi:MAG: LysR family transcriptional regulator [Pseudomonadota bacterium]
MSGVIHRDIDVALLRAFLAVVENGSMTKAARQLNLTQAAVSMQIKRLEVLFQKTLFDRDGKTLILTPTGERLVSQARRMVSLNDEIWNTIVAPEFEGEITLGVPHDIVGTYMPKILREFSRAWPNIRVSLFCETTPILLSKLEEGVVDLTLTTQSAPGDDLLLADQLVWAGMPNGEAHMQNPLPVSLGGEKCAFRASALNSLANVGRDWTLVAQFGSMEPALAAVEADLAVAPLMKQTVPEKLEILTENSGLPKLPVFFINLINSGQSVNPAVKELASAIRTGFARRMQKAA